MQKIVAFKDMQPTQPDNLYQSSISNEICYFINNIERSA